MSDSKPMDTRCPRQLKTNPTSWCPLAVLRLKAIRNAGRELTEEEVEKLPGCVWAVNHQLANYCFFQYMSEYGDGHQASDIEIAALMCTSVDTVKKLEKSALQKIRDFKSFKELKDSLDKGESPVDERITIDDLGIYI